ncbi:MAG: hypothetical protein H7Y18_06365 [Clostridiaceae bacterium]|nr:hypothetical protein [Clostridiaceae bacterium]
MTDTLVNQIMGIVVQAVLMLLGLLATWGIKEGLNYLEGQREFLIQKIGIDKYNLSFSIAKNIFYTLEQQFKFIPQSGNLKAQEFDKLLLNKIPGLSQEELDHFREAVVGEFNSQVSNSKLLVPAFDPTIHEANITHIAELDL